MQQNRFSLCFSELSDKPTGWRSLVMGDIMGKGRVLRGGAERGSDKTEISHCTENSPVDKKTKACPAGSVLSHWEKDKGGQGRGQAALGGGEGSFCCAYLSIPQELWSHSWKSFESLSTIHSTDHVPAREKAQKGMRAGHTQGPASDSLGPDCPGQVMGGRQWEGLALYPEAMGSH